MPIMMTIYDYLIEKTTGAQKAEWLKQLFALLEKTAQYDESFKVVQKIVQYDPCTTDYRIHLLNKLLDDKRNKDDDDDAVLFSGQHPPHVRQHAPFALQGGVNLGNQADVDLARRHLRAVLVHQHPRDLVRVGASGDGDRATAGGAGADLEVLAVPARHVAARLVAAVDDDEGAGGR